VTRSCFSILAQGKADTAATKSSAIRLHSFLLGFYILPVALQFYRFQRMYRLSCAPAEIHARHCNKQSATCIQYRIADLLSASLVNLSKIIDISHENSDTGPFALYPFDETLKFWTLDKISARRPVAIEFVSGLV
jgi:hypothetical protein